MDNSGTNLTCEVYLTGNSPSNSIAAGIFAGPIDFIRDHACYVATDYPTYTLMTTSSLSSAYAYAAGLCRTAPGGPGYTINATASAQRRRQNYQGHKCGVVSDPDTLHSWQSVRPIVVMGLQDRAPLIGTVTTCAEAPASLEV